MDFFVIVSVIYFILFPKISKILFLFLDVLVLIHIIFTNVKISPYIVPIPCTKINMVYILQRLIPTWINILGTKTKIRRIKNFQELEQK